MAEENDLDKLLLQGISVVFLGIGLANMPPKERGKLAKQLGVTDEELDPCVLGCLAAKIVELSPGKEITDHADDNDKQHKGQGKGQAV